MNDRDKSKEELITEVAALRRQVARQDASPELKRAALLFERAPLSIHECDIEGRITFVNPWQQAVTGFTADELVGTYIWDRIPPGPERDSLPAYFKQLVAEQPTPTPFFAKNLRKGGEVFEARIDWNYLHDPHGELVGFVSVVSDVTDLKQAKEFNEGLVASMSDGLSVLDGDGVHVEVNDAFCRMTGFDRDELIGVGPPHPYWPPEQCDRIQQTLEQVVRGETQQHEFVFMRKNGDRFPVILAPSRTTNRDGSFVNYFATFKDISERKEIEERLRESERRLSTLMSNLPGAVYRCRADEDWTVEFLSDGYQALTGYDPAAMIGQPGTRHSELVLPEDRLREYELVQQAVAERRPYEVEYRLQTAAGEEKWLWERGAGVFSDNGELEAIEGFTTDITAQKRAEQELRRIQVELEHRVEQRTAEVTKANDELRIFKTFAETSAEGFGMVDAEGKIVYVNPALAHLVGELDPQEALGKHPSAYYAEGYQELLETEILPALGRDGLWRGELTMVSATGEMIPVLQTSFMLLDDDGVPIRRGVVVTDLRKIEETKDSLKASLDELQAIYDGMPDGLVLVELPSRRFRRVNPALCSMLGYSQDELLSMTVDEIHPPESLAHVDEVSARLFGGKPASTEAFPMLRKDGTVFRADASAVTIFVEGKPCAVGFFRDITVQLETQRRLRKSEAKYKALVESSPDAIVMCDLDGRITFASPQAAERHRVRDASELIGRSAMELVVERDRDLMRQRIRMLLESGTRRNDEYVGLRIDGTTFFSEASGAIIKDATGEPESFMAVYRDITERKEAQESLYRMLQASDRERELMTYDIHDGVAQQLLGAKMHFDAVAQLEGGVAAEAMQSFAAGQAALGRASAEARSLMNRTRTPVLQGFGVRPAIADFIDQYFDEEGAPEFIYHCEARFRRLEPVLENAIFRVVQEAITNACNHSKCRVIRVSVVQRADEVTIEIQDDGIGFDTSEVKENCFGLHGIRERARLLGKYLAIESKLGEGTRIAATFPLIYRRERAE